jgi:hypothetical protein
MNTKLLMRTSAVFMGLVGAAALFLPQEILAHAGANPGRLSALVVQLAGAVYLGFAALNWAAQAKLIGGIYSRPVALGNFIHFTVASIALIKVVIAGERDVMVLAGLAVDTILAVMFALVMFGRTAGPGTQRE